MSSPRDDRGQSIRTARADALEPPALDFLEPDYVRQADHRIAGAAERDQLHHEEDLANRPNRAERYLAYETSLLGTCGCDPCERQDGEECEAHEG